MPLRPGLVIATSLALAACSDGSGTSTPGTPSAPGVEKLQTPTTGTFSLNEVQGVGEERAGAALTIVGPRPGTLTADFMDRQLVRVQAGLDNVTSTVNATEIDPEGNGGFELSQNGGDLVGFLTPEIDTRAGPATLEYMLFGTWSDGTAFDGFESVAFHGGNRTPAGDVPSGGQASYSGTAVGFYTSGDTNGSVREAYTARVSVTTDDFEEFAFATTNSELSGFGEQDELNQTATLRRDGNTLSGSIDAGTNFAGSVDARFYGSDAVEMGGAFSLIAPTNAESVVASFGALRDPDLVAP